MQTGDAPKPMQLFDLHIDPGEQRDGAAEHPDEMQRLKAAEDAMNSDAPVIEEFKRVPYKKP